LSVVVLIPCHRSDLSESEQVSLRQCRSILGSHDCRMLVPEGLRLPEAASGLATEPFAPRHFASVQSYSRLLLSPEFYDRFALRDFMLIHQLDAWVFRDEVERWCRRGFDCIGAPWEEGAPFLRRRKLWRHHPWPARRYRLARMWHRRTFRVGNGGFSLRRIGAFRRILKRNSSVADAWTANEDLFWSLLAPALDRGFLIPSEAEARKFSVETRPRWHVRRMGGRLPFGCHHWTRNEPDFWLPHLGLARNCVE